MVEGQGQVAGRLEVPVESDTKGFKSKLKKKIEAATKGLEAKVGLEVEGKGLRKQIQAQVDKAAAGVKVTIGIDLDASSLRAKVEAAAKTAGGKVNVTVGTDGHLVEEVAAESEAAEKAAPEVKVPVRAKVKGFFKELLEARAAAAAAAAANPVEIPVKVKTKGRGLSGRTLLRVGLIGSLVSLIQPAIGALAQLVGGLTAVVGAAAPAAGAIAAIPVGLSAIIQMAVGTKVAMGGVGDALKLVNQEQAKLARGEKMTAAETEKLNQAMSELSPSAKKVVKQFASLRPEWVKTRKVIQEALFGPIAGEIKPLAKTLLPLLEKGLARTAGTMGSLVQATARWARTPLFQRQFSGIMDQNNTTIAAGAGAILDMAHGFMFFQRAAAPFQARLDGVIRSFGDWFLMTSRSNARNGDTAAFLEKAGDRLKILWNITKQFSGGIAGIFRAGDQSGMRLLTDFEDFLTKWNDWSNSLAGQNRMKAWFDSAEAGFRSISLMVHDTGIALLKWGEDPKIVGMLEKIRTELGPALNDLFQSLGDSLGTGAIDLITELTRTIAHLEPAIEIAGQLTKALAGLLGVINDLADANPAAADNVAKIVGALLLMRSAGKLGGLVGLGGKAGKGGKGGLLGLLGLGGAGAKTAAKDLEGVAASGGRLSKVFKSPIAKKAGLLGALFTAIDLGSRFEKDQHNYSGAADKMLAGFDEKGKATAQTIADLKDEFKQGNLADNADKLGIDLDRLAKSMAEGGKQGTYYKDVLAKLKDKSSWLGDMGGILNPIGDTDSLRASEAIDDLEKLGTTIDDLRAKAKGPGLDLFSGGMGAVSGAITKGLSQAAKLKASIAGLPKAVQTQIETPGVVNSIKYVQVLRGQYNLTPKQVMTTLTASGVVKTIKDVREAQRTFHLTPKQVVTLVKANGIKPAMSDILQLHREFKLTPKQVVTLLKATGKDFALGQVRALAKEYHLTPKQVVTLLKAQDSASGLARSVASIYAGIPRVVRTQIIATRQGKADAQMARAGGGPIYGPGTGTSDSILARLSNGEFVVKAKSVKKYGLAMLNRINDGVMPAFARGGQALVGRISNGVSSAAEFARDRAAIRKLTSSATEKRLVHMLERLWRQGRTKIDLDKKLSAAQTKLTDAVNHRDAIRAGLRTAGADYGSLATIAGANGGFAAPKFMVGELKRRLGDTQEYRKLLTNLRNKGLSKDAYEQISSLSVDEGLPLARQLASASSATIKQISSLQAQIAGTANAIGADTSKKYYDAGIAAAQGLVRGLKSRQGVVNKAATAMAKSMVKSLKHTLKIKSPSRVTDSIGGFTADGLGVGLNRRGKHVLKDARTLAERLADELTPDLSQLRATNRVPGHLETLRKSAGQASRSVSPTAMNQRLAPLVENLTIQGKDEAEIRSGLDEAMFKLRLLRSGGVHADRTI